MVRSHGRRAGSSSVGSFAAADITTDSFTVRQGNGILGTPVHHINYESDLSSAEVARVSLDAGEVIEVWRLDSQLKSGGTDSNVVFDVYDSTNSTVIASTTAGSLTKGTDSPVGSSGEGATVIARVSTGSSAVDLCTSGVMSVVKE